MFAEIGVFRKCFHMLYLRARCAMLRGCRLGPGPVRRRAEPRPDAIGRDRNGGRQATERQQKMREHESQQRLADALAQIVAGAYVLTVNADGQPRAIVLSFVQQVGLDPPRLAVAVHKSRGVVEALVEGREFVLNVIADDGRAAIEKLASSLDAGAALHALAAAPWGAGFALSEASARVACSVGRRVDIDDHWLYICEALSGESEEGRRPLVHSRRSGLRY